MLFQTGLVRQLAEQMVSIALVLPDATDENLRQLKNHPNIQVFDPEIRQTIWDDDYGVKRMYFLEDLHSNPVFYEKHLYSILYTKSLHPWKRIRPFIYYPIHQLTRVFPGIKKWFKKREKRHLESPKATALLKQIKPKLVVSTYPINFLESKFLYAAQQLKITTVIHLLSWDNITSKGIFPGHSR